MESTDARKKILQEWLSQQAITLCAPMCLLPHDASFRRYYRIRTPHESLIVMDAPPSHEDCRPFVAIARALRAHGLNTPKIVAQDVTQGFLLLTDFGDQTYLKALNAQNANELYQRALAALAILQGVREIPDRVIPPFTSELMLQEWAWHKEWFLQKLLGLTPEVDPALDDCYQQIVALAAAQPQVLMHRDYHAGNLMVLPEGVGILDFQDAFVGPVTYDLVSLLRDCYIDWPAQKITDWMFAYQRLLMEQGVSGIANRAEFMCWFDWMGVQRQLKALMTFARKKVRDQQPLYLKFVPRTLHYLLTVTERYAELKVLHRHLQVTVKPAIAKVVPLCVL